MAGYHGEMIPRDRSAEADRDHRDGPPTPRSERSLLALAVVFCACGGTGGNTGPTSQPGTDERIAKDDANTGRGDGKPTVSPSAEPARRTDSTIDGREVDEQAFDRTLRALDVDKEPLVVKHLTNGEGDAGTGATYEARDRRTGKRWTYTVRSIGGHSSRSLTRNSKR
jgi:hypothetical protein